RARGRLLAVVAPEPAATPGRHHRRPTGEQLGCNATATTDQRCYQERESSRASKGGSPRPCDGTRTHNFTGREPITSAPTVGRGRGKWRSAQRFPVVPWKGWGRRFDSGGGLHTKTDQRKRWR